MPQNSQKHAEQQEVKFNNDEFSQGMNPSSPATALLQGECVLIENFYFDFASGYLRTRYPFRKYTNNILNGAPVTGITRWNDNIYFVSGTKLFYLDNSLNANYLGQVGPNPPCFLPFNSKLLIASGTVLQQVNSSKVFATDTGTGMPTTLTNILELNQQVYGVGNTAYPDVLHSSSVRNDTVFSGGTSEQFYLTYQEEPNVTVDDFYIRGITKAPGGYIIVWKGGNQRKATGFLNPDSTNPVWRTVSDNEAAHTWRGCTWVGGYLWFMDSFSPMAIAGVSSMEELNVDSGSLKVGARIASQWIVDDDAFCVVYPPHAQIWFFPKKANYFWVLHYNTGAWVKFKLSGSLQFCSGYYQPLTKTLYLGGNDGNIYTYDTTGTGNYQDNPGGVDTDYGQKIISKIYNLYPRNKHEIKKPIMVYRGITDGTGILKIFDNFGTDKILESSFTISSSFPRLYDWRTTTLYDLRSTLLWSDASQKHIIDKSPEVNNFQVWFEVTSGAIEFQEITADIAKTTKII